MIIIILAIVFVKAIFQKFKVKCKAIPVTGHGGP
jgi:hypothetical protein